MLLRERENRLSGHSQGGVWQLPRIWQIIHAMSESPESLLRHYFEAVNRYAEGELLDLVAGGRIRAVYHLG